MKKRILTLGLFVAMMLGMAKIMDAKPPGVLCFTTTVECSDGSQHYAMNCAASYTEAKMQDQIWNDLLCG